MDQHHCYIDQYDESSNIASDGRQIDQQDVFLDSEMSASGLTIGNYPLASSQSKTPSSGYSHVSPSQDNESLPNAFQCEDVSYDGAYVLTLDAPDQASRPPVLPSFSTSIFPNSIHINARTSTPSIHSPYEGYSSPIHPDSHGPYLTNSSLTSSRRSSAMNRQQRNPSYPLTTTRGSDYVLSPGNMEADGDRTPRTAVSAVSAASSGAATILPWASTKQTADLIDANRRIVLPEIYARIDKGFFMSDTDWTCYRRNYFAVACAYSLTVGGKQCEPNRALYLSSYASDRPVDQFAVCIAACVNDDENKAVELVQHTPKRDKGPTSTPKITLLKPNPSGNLGGSSASSINGPYSPSPAFFPSHEHGGFARSALSSPSAADDQQIVNFERIQFKKATANNGKRRAQQQYFHLRVELFAGFRKTSETGRLSSSSTQPEDGFDWTRVATRLSAQMVVRGRSPGHYTTSNGQANHSSMGGGGPGPGNTPGGGHVGGGIGGPMSGAYGSGHPGQIHSPSYGLSGNYGGSYGFRRAALSGYEQHIEAGASAPSGGGEHIEESYLGHGGAMDGAAAAAHDRSSSHAAHGPIGLLSPIESSCTGPQLPPRQMLSPALPLMHQHRHHQQHPQDPSRHAVYKAEVEGLSRPPMGTAPITLASHFDTDLRLPNLDTSRWLHSYT